MRQRVLAQQDTGVIQVPQNHAQENMFEVARMVLERGLSFCVAREARRGQASEIQDSPIPVPVVSPGECLAKPCAHRGYQARDRRVSPEMQAKQRLRARTALAQYLKSDAAAGMTGERKERLRRLFGRLLAA